MGCDLIGIVKNPSTGPLTDFGGKTSIFSHPVYLFLREFSLQDFRGGSKCFATQLQRVGRSTILRLISPALSKYTNPIISHS
ncbi:hypothetical protein UP84_26870 [Escherichia coli]|nr:hypothetical protein UP84_26870 [Escherichia coli]